MSASVLRKLQQARQQLQNGNIDAAAALCEDILRRAPRHPEALWLLGTARLMANRLDEAIALLARAADAGPNQGAALENLGLAYLMRGENAPAEAALRKAAAIPGAPASVPMRLGVALLNLGRHEEAIVELRRALERDPRYPDAQLNLGRAYGAAGRWTEAARQFETLLEALPYHADAMYNLGVVAFEQSDFEHARAWFETCLAREPEHVEARERLAAAFIALGRYPQAGVHLSKVVEMQPRNADAMTALAQARFQAGALDEALSIAARARDLDPARPAPYNLIGQIHHVRGELDQAAQILRTGFERTHADALLGALMHVLHRQCDWTAWSEAWAEMARRLDASSELGSPFWLLPEATTPEQQLSYTTRWVERNYPAALNSVLRVSSGPKPGERVRIGYYSGDFHQHPVPCLLAEVLELHDRSRFEVFAYSYGPDDKRALRARLERAVEHFIDVAWDPDDLVVQRIKADELHVLVDLKGYTAGDRLRVMAQRPCVVQVAWLGYPATTGAPFIDYLIADPFIVPADAERHFSEHVLRLPHAYQPNDRKRTATLPRPRAEYGLPDEAFIFCCFNQAVKITPDVFSRWMNLLRAVPGSVLWLLEDNRWASANILSAAQAAGVDRARVVIASRLSPAEHLARYRAADLALDTFPYTSHTTGSDALWLGCPLVALCGETFAARVSASLLVNCGISELVTRTLDDYEKLAYRLATDAEFLRDVRTRLAAARDSAPLFDSRKFARDLEALYLEIAR
ncbi:MAG TPA: tetratricopeptide repeat protein [Burkholderiales bacterium]|nr:tetratricopeptide repeat protein [Burkholderiales bacterium]